MKKIGSTKTIVGGRFFRKSKGFYVSLFFPDVSPKDNNSCTGSIFYTFMLTHFRPVLSFYSP